MSQELTPEFTADFMKKAVDYAILENLAISICLYGRGNILLAQQNVTLPEFRPFTQTIAELKAKLAAHVGRRTSYIRDQINAEILTSELLGINPHECVKFAGGCPIYYDDGTLLGGLGISGLSQEEDEKHCIHLIATVPGNHLLSNKP